MYDREITCSKCDETSLMIRDETNLGWIFIDSNWANIGGLYYCPKCKKRYFRNRICLRKRKQMYPEIVMYPCDDE